MTFTQIQVTIALLAYVLGLLVTGIPGHWGIISTGGLVSLGLGMGAAIVLPQFWYVGPRARFWVMAGVIAFGATLYLQIRTPQPAMNDISRLVGQEGKASNPAIVVVGKIESSPRLNRKQRVQFLLQAQETHAVGDQRANTTQRATTQRTVSGKVYVTVPLLQGTGLHPGQIVEVSGRLYKPRSAANPGAFDFQAYLMRQGIFAGLTGWEVQRSTPEQGQWGWWQIRRRIIQVQAAALGSPGGPLVSAMVMGNRTVDLPYDLTDRFTKIGLTHTVAASGFQVSLILGFVLLLLQQRSSWMQFTVGTTALLLFLGLTGLSPSILRASLMGVAALAASTLERRVKPLGALLLAGVVLLVCNPLWIWDLGFQLSFLATFGLVTTVAPIVKRLDWIPAKLAPIVAVPLAASIWTMPLQLYQFGVFSPYSPFVNILTTPFVVITSLGGIASAIVALIWPLGGVWVTGLLKYPTLLFLEIVDFSSELPGSSIAVGKASVIQLLVIYGLMVLVWLRPWFSKRWWTAAPVMISLIFIPSWYYQANLAQITIVADGKIPTLIFQDRGQVSLVNSGGQDAATYTIVPFLHQQGVNQIDWVLSTDNLTANRQGWLRVLQDFPIQVFYDASDSTEQAPTEERWSQEAIQNALADRQGTYQSVTWGQALSIGSVRLTALTQDFHCWLCQWQDASWLWLWDQNQEAQTQLATVLSLPDPVFLWWSGELLAPALLKKLSLQGAIASDQEIDFQTLQRLKTQHIPTYWTGRDGALQWSPGQEIQPTLDLVDSGF